tara:strand:+ start:152 stop:5806 length:5655 start_codon:yes stop_codon:yes gene_type:complete
MPQKPTKSKPEGFTHGMVSDSDPRFQIKGSYTDGQNIRLTNSTGDTFTVENINGNSLFIDLFALNSQSKLAAYNANSAGMLETRTDIPLLGAAPLPTDLFSEIYWDPNNTTSTGNLVGPLYPSPVDNFGTVGGDGVFTFYDNDGSSLERDSSIVGYTSFGNELILIIVIESSFIKMSSSPFYVADPNGSTRRTVFLRIVFDVDMNVEKVEDLMVSYSHQNDHYPNLGMKIDQPVRVESIIENECISRIYWTDNINPLRTLNLQQEGKNQLSPSSLDITPLMDPSQPVLDMTIHGSLPVGVYQYTYKYISANGGETTFSPLSNIYHVSNQSFTSSSTYGGGPKGELGTQGFRINIDDVDQDFTYIELYALLYEDLNLPPRICLVDRKRLTGLPQASFTHVAWNNEIENGLEEILIESNTWDICKDIAIKDNILFAANLKQKKNWISEKEWNVKVLRYNIEDGGMGGSAAAFDDGILTTNDPEVKHYEGDGSGGFQIPEIASVPKPCTGFLHNSLEHRPAWATFVDLQRAGPSTALQGSIKLREEYRFLRDGVTLGGESWDYEANDLGGCRVTFGLQEKVADITTNDGNKPYISSVNNGSEDFQTDNVWGEILGTTTNNTDTTFKTSMAIAGSMDPHNSGDKRGYQRGEIYRFGVQIYDINGAPGNVLWIGDIQMPEMYDVLRQLDPTKGGYNPMSATTANQTGIPDLQMTGSFVSLPKTLDHRLSYIWSGNTTPPVDVNWFTSRIADSGLARADAYLDSQGALLDSSFPLLGERLNPVTFDNQSGGTLHAKWYSWFNAITPFGPPEHDDKHYLFDLYVNFEFIIPRSIMEKMSGFRVVRAERTENDRRIIQQGILNQTMAYGSTAGLDRGYDDRFPWSREDNQYMDDEPVFINDYDTGSPSLPVQPEYDTYLNGYLGLAENNHFAWWDDTVTNGKIPAGNNFGKLYAFTENLESREAATGSAWPYRIANTPVLNSAAGEHPGPAAHGIRTGHSAFFGSYEKMQSGDYNTTTIPRANAANHVSGVVFTLDSPDSAFGTRPYVFKEGDLLRIDSLMKLSDERKYQNIGGMWPNHPRDYTRFSWYWPELGGPLWEPIDKDWLTSNALASRYGNTEQEALRFASKKQLDNDKDYGMLLGKYFIYDTYWGIGMETDGGITYAKDNLTNVPDTAKPSEDYRYFAEITAAKELGAGEIVPSGFFKSSYHMTSGDSHGFSNHTLGVISDVSPWNAKWGGPRHKTSGNPALVTSIDGTVNGSGTSNSITSEDLNYNTMSSLQMGLRTIVIEAGMSTYQFNPRNLVSILANQSWVPRDAATGVIDPTLSNTNPAGHLQNISTGGIPGYKSYIPFKYLCSIVRKTIPYGGYSKSAIESTRYVPAGNFHPIIHENYGNDPKIGHLSKVFGGDTFVNLYAHQKTSCPYMGNSYARWQVFPVESFVNTDMRSGLNLGSGDTEVGESNVTPPFSNDWLYNEVYSQENNIKSSIMINEDQACEALDLPFEIAYSNTKISGEPGDAFRVFPINQFHDMEGQYGEINRIINFKNDIYILQDEAFAKLLVNPISMITDDTGVGIFTGTGDTVENHTYVTTKFGSRHLWSVVGSEEALYFVDSRYARLFKYDTEKLISLGDSLGVRSRLEFAIKGFGDLDSVKKGSGWNTRNYISDNHLRFLGIQSIFDHKNKELLVTTHNSQEYNENIRYSETLVFNEGLNAFTSYYSAVPSVWMLADPAIISTGNEVSVRESITNPTGAPLREGSLKLWLWDSSPVKSEFFPDAGFNQPAPFASVEKVINDAAESAKVFDNGEIIMTGTPGIVSLGNPMGAGVGVSFETENNPLGIVSAPLSRYRDGVLRFPTRGLTALERMRGTWLKIKFTYSGNEKFNIFAMIAKYRKSYN